MMGDINSMIKILEAKLIYLKHIQNIKIQDVADSLERGESIIRNVISCRENPDISRIISNANNELDELVQSVTPTNLKDPKKSLTLPCDSGTNFRISVVSSAGKSSELPNCGLALSNSTDSKNAQGVKHVSEEVSVKSANITFEIPDPITKNGVFTDMVHLRGKNPRNFWLGFSSTKNVNIFSKVLEKRDVQKPLIPVTVPKKGDFICASDGNSMLRAKVLSVDFENEELSVVNVDTGCECKVNFKSTWLLDEDVARFPAQAINCTLKGDFGSYKDWNEAMDDMFELLLSKSELLVKVHHITKGDTTRYLVDVKVIDEKSNVKDNVDASLWIQTCLLSKADSTFPPTRFSDEPLSVEERKSTTDMISENRELALEFVNNVSTDEELPIGFESKVYISHIVSPGEFYVFLAASKQLLKKMQASMSRKPLYYDKDKACKEIGSYCMFFHSESNTWTRGKVMDWNPIASSDHVIVYALDIGKSFTVSWKSLQSLEFSQYKPLAIRCHLANICPNSTSGEWSDESIGFFQCISQEDYLFDLEVVDHDKTVNPLSHSVVITYIENRTEINVNEYLVSTECALFVSVADNKDEVVPYNNNQVNERDHLDSWDPLQAAFYAPSNSYDVPEDDPVYQVMGYKPEDDSRVCMYFGRTGRCPRPPGACTKEHIRLDPQGMTVLKEDIFSCTYSPIEIPERGSVVTLQVTHVDRFLTFFARILPSIQRSDEETLDSLTEFMNNEKNVRAMKRFTFFPANGEIVLARFHADNRFYRAQVLTEVDNNDNVSVYFIDYGNKESVHESDLRQIEPRYLHLPPQVLRCQIANFKPFSQIDGMKEYLDVHYAIGYFIDLVKHKSLKARVVYAAVNSTEELEVLLYDGSEDIGNILVNQGFGQLQEYSLVPIETPYLPG